MRLGDHSLDEFLKALAAKSPTPGGGAVAALLLGTSASLAQMVVNYSLGKKNLSSHNELHLNALDSLRRIASDATELAERDAHAYARLNELLKLSPDDHKRIDGLPNAINDSIDPPMTVIESALNVLRLLQELSGKTNRLLTSDLAIAAMLADAAVRSAAWNVKANLPLLNDQNQKTELSSRLSQLTIQSQTLCSDIVKVCENESS